jgi:hypothetical protein
MQAGWSAGLRASSIDKWAAGYVIGSPPTCRKRIFAIISLVSFLQLDSGVRTQLQRICLTVRTRSSGVSASTAKSASAKRC